MIRLGVNVDHVATIRNARGESYPDPVHAAASCELGGAENITCHLREDRRHIKDDDVARLRNSINIPLNFEIAHTEEMMTKALEIKPHAVTLVPEKREELTTEGGLDVDAYKSALEPSITALKEAGILASLFVEPDMEAVKASAELKVDALEFHTGHFCNEYLKAISTKQKAALMRPFQECASFCVSKGIQVHVGHGLNYLNAHWMQLIEGCEEANIGHAIIARSVFTGLTNAVQEMKDLLNNPSFKP
jgi:pyridoxine 5-phosphate synthase